MKRFLMFVFYLVSISVSAQTNSDSTYKYTWMNYDLNYIQFYDRSVLETFCKKWKETGVKKMSIVHMGDSHIQSDILPGEVRNILQPILGYGGRGMIFPYSAANSYSSVYYKSVHTGIWEYCKSYQEKITLPLGVSGITIKTRDSSASFTINFNSPLPEHYLNIKFFCKKESSSYDFILSTGGNQIKINVDSSIYKNKPYIEISVPTIGTSISVQLLESDTSQHQFEFYGMDVESNMNSGLTVHSVGVGASQYRAILRQDLVEEQLASLNPDLVILDWGTNDYLYDDKIKDSLEQTIIKVIQRVRNAAPNTTILLTTTMDMFRKGRNVKSGPQFSDLIRKIAKEQKCAFWDWYWITGGSGMMLYFRDNGLGQKDMIHLTQKGYKMKGKLLTDAMIATLKMLDENKNLDSLLFPVDSLKAKQVITTSAKQQNTNPLTPKIYYHKVAKGESLSVIAKKYAVTTKQIMLWNNMKTTKIKIGQVLVIYSKKKL